MRLLKFVVFHPVKTLLVLVLGTALGFASFYAYRIQSTFDDISVESFDPDQARRGLARSDRGFTAGAGGLIGGDALDPSEFGPPDDLYPKVFGDPIPDEVFESYLLLGSDASGSLADTIIYVLQPARDGRPIMVSIPRDLYVWNMCKQRYTRINEGLGGCRGQASGPELMAIMVEDYTGIPVDHLARIDFQGFSRLIDVMGGIQACVDRPTRDINSGLLIEQAGCHVLDGGMALAWVRSRHTEEMIDGEWKAVAASDFTRQGKQQDVLFQLAAKAARFQSPGALAERLGAVSGAIRLDSGWTFSSAVSTAWRYRGIRKDDVVRFGIDASNMRSPEGAAVLTPKKKFTDHLREVIDLDALLEGQV
ncbi:MAG: LCP family protein [Actinomycetes bacterium]